MSPAPRIAVVGSANIDLVTFTDRFPGPGETIFGQDFDLGFGGKGANQAVAARLCGAQVSMVARLGADLFGPSTIKNFESHQIDTSHVRMLEGVSSGVAPIFVEPNGQNRIWVVKGANDKLMPADVDEAAPMLKQAACIILQFEIPLETVYYTMRFARANGIKCILNPAPGQPVDLNEVRNVDYFVPNESEAETISGKPVKSIEDAKACAKYFLEQGIPRVIITLGENGALLAGDGTLELISACKVDTKDTSGAGDAFIGSFATFLGEGLPEKEAISQACLYASLSTMNVGTQKSFLKRADFENERKARR
jgi:ribokinase